MRKEVVVIVLWAAVTKRDVNDFGNYLGEDQRPIGLREEDNKAKMK